ncbi:hypothetical protein BDV98DRAFT_571643 [Pterulicium gracile]|uniref:Uncharacterized protein n=1 Tax=Pterulicium gracile TaxID=1884261 RepID=A0A5C3QD54_9AGAR|nr:hypothetical protein BDV98DRAFT_571643 [Pterula gracilis]
MESKKQTQPTNCTTQTNSHPHMPLFGRRRAPVAHSTTTRATHHRRFYRKDKDRVAGGYKAALANPHTTREGRSHAKHELHKMGRSSHVPLMTKIKRTLGIRSTPRQKRTVTTTTTRRRRRY